LTGVAVETLPNEFDAVPEGIIDIDAARARKFITSTTRVARGFQTLDQRRQILDTQGRVRLLGRSEVWLDSQVDLDHTALEPTAATRSLRKRLRHLGEP
jgi:hypothetical protein